MHSPDINRRIRELPVTGRHAEDRIAMELDLPGSAEAAWEHLVEPDLLATWSPVVPDRRLTTVGPALSRERPEDDPV
ncbi:MAG: hypothetical protein Q4G40_02810, partial [Brachybacterium sp.]|nr:hypothetical protein [Brachybacterium sp.]